MKHYFSLTLFLSAALSLSAMSVQQVEPLSWWVGMNTPLTLMLHGEDLADAQVTINKLNGKKLVKGVCTGLQLRGQHNAESANYLFLDLAANEQGTYRITLKKGKRTVAFDYVIGERRAGSRERTSFTSADCIYLLMSDRFVDGDPSNNTLPSMREKADKSNVNGRWGGDIQGIINSLDHIRSLGATAVWPTPLLCDDEKDWSYHGYACSDYYHIDPRYGSNELYCEMVAKAHEKGIKILMDMVPNHCGAAHWWMKDLPYKDWVNQFPSFTNTVNAFSANYDINASSYDRDLSNRGWFDHPMPDMNLDNPDLLRYFSQWAVWWIEYADLDGLRVDTYPYIGKEASALWCKAIRDEYPNINIVGECWTRPASAVAYWQSGARNYDGYDSGLPSVMDFPVEEAIRQALENDGNYWGGGLTRIYDAVAMDYLYADVNQLLLFVGNHDMDRFADAVKDGDLRRVKMGHALVATMRGIPQIFAGDEYAMRSSDRSLGHSTLRMPLPLKDTLNSVQRDIYDYVSRLYTWRKAEPVLHTGRTMHFIGRDNTYAFFRYNDWEAVFVFANAAEEKRDIPVEHYAEILSRYNPVGTDVLTGRKVSLSRSLTAAPVSTLIVKLKAR
ncbi:MAG: cyclomaltodextrinase C-terminal domain-containing protein [Paludibacteraceae bacterium]|nr:cyclomaltodextrinase C-terminal domain-containing protein [Paludibacteraceae bacterium]